MVKNIEIVGIVGAGFMGKQIAAQAALHDFRVKICDKEHKIVEDAEKYISGVLKCKNRINAIKEVSHYILFKIMLEDMEYGFNEI